MRRFVLLAYGLALALLLAACGNKGPLVRAATDPATAATVPASTATALVPATTAPAPAASAAADRQP